MRRCQGNPAGGRTTFEIPEPSIQFIGVAQEKARVLGETSLSVLAERETFDLNERRL
jgi:hypothetical protein